MTVEWPEVNLGPVPLRLHQPPSKQTNNTEVFTINGV
jgi:hypothetical protein